LRPTAPRSRGPRKCKGFSIQNRSLQTRQDPGLFLLVTEKRFSSVNLHVRDRVDASNGVLLCGRLPFCSIATWQDEDNVADIDLNQKGRIRAAALAALLWPAPVWFYDFWTCRVRLWTPYRLPTHLHAGHFSAGLHKAFARLPALQHTDRPRRCNPTPHLRTCNEKCETRQTGVDCRACLAWANACPRMDLWVGTPACMRALPSLPLRVSRAWMV